MGVTLFDDASLVLIPSGIKTSKVYSVKPDDGTGDLDFSRASDATRVNSAGLIEKVRTNLFLQSEAFNTASWIKTNVTLTSGILSPDGTNDAFRAESTGVASMIQVLTMTNGLTYNISLWIKSAGTGKDTLRLLQQTNRFLDVTATNEWVRYNFSFTNTYATAGQNNGIARDALGNAFDVYIYGFQIEVAEAVSDYIPTTTAAVTVGITNNVPRLDYSGGATCPRLLLEPQRTNLVLRNEEFDNAAWLKSNITVTPNVETSPDGYTNADKIVGSVALPDLRTASTITITSGISYTWSAYVKNAGYKYVRLIAWTSDDPVTTFDLDAISVVSETGPAHTSTITDVGNGWRRITITRTSTAAAAWLRCFPLANATGTIGQNGVDGIYLWGAQVEAGSFVSSYIPTTTAAVTRLADTASRSIPSIISATGGTFIVDTMPTISTGLNQTIGTVNDGSTARGFWLGMNAGELILRYRNGATISGTPGPTITNGQRIKAAVKWDGTNFTLFANGVKYATVSSGHPSTINSVGLNGDGVFFQISQHRVNQSFIFPTPLTDAQCIELTTL